MAEYHRACAAIIRDGSIVMLYVDHGSHGHWTLPGGGVEDGEAPEQAVIREVVEETGMHAANPKWLWERAIRDGRETCFLVAVPPDEEPVLGHDPELEAHAQDLRAIAWRPLADLHDDVQVSRVIEALRQRGG